MTELQFVDELPNAPQGSAKTKERAAEIKENAPRWAQWPSQTPPSSVKKSLDKIDGDYEVVGRKCADGKTRAFVRYAPADEPSSNGHAAIPPPAAVGNGAQLKVRCPACSAMVNIEAGEDGPKALARHESTNTVCKAANRRRR